MSNIDKSWALNQLRHKKNTLALTTAAQSLLNSNAIFSLSNKVSILNKDGIFFNCDKNELKEKELYIDYDQIIYIYKNDKNNYLYDLEQYFKFIRRNIFIEIFETVKAYSKNNDCFDDLKNENWYDYYRVIRNSLTHDFHFRFNQSDMQKLPLTYSGSTIDASMQDLDFTGLFLTPADIGLAFENAFTFIENH